MKKLLPGITFLGLVAMATPTAFASVDCTMSTFGTTYAEPGQEYQFYSQVTNKGTEDITSLTYKQTIDDQEKSFTIEFDPIAVGSKRYIAFKAAAPDEVDVTKTMKIQVTAINGTEVTKTVVSGKVTTAEFVPVHRSVVEDYTGTWCKFCPQGYVAMEAIRRDYPESVLGIAYHAGDPMYVNTFTEPQSVNGYPTMRVNRSTDDPNNTGSAVTVAQTSVKATNSLAPVAVSLDVAEWLDDEYAEAYCKATLEFANAVSDGEYKVEFALIEDGLQGSGSSWKQMNYYAGKTAAWNDPLWDTFTNGGSYVSVEFNDVCIANTLKLGSGFVSAVPATEGRTEISFEYTFKKVNTIKEYGSTKSILKNPDKCRIAVIVSNASTKAVANCDWAPLTDASGIRDITSDAVSDSSAEKEYFTLQGMKVSSDNLTPGLYIVRQGNKTSKVIIR